MPAHLQYNLDKINQSFMKKDQKLQFVPLAEIRRIRKEIKEPIALSQILADIFRINTLSMIMEAGSGHIGSSFSSMDIVTWLLTHMEKADTYFSSKGHDVPALYSVLIGLEKLDFDFVHRLRRLNGLPGHPDIQTPGIVTNTGALGMGISKARGMAISNRSEDKKGRFYVLTGDGELQEGQFWESLQPTANGKFSEITIIVDHNKIQSDVWVKNTSSLGDLEAKFSSFGWFVQKCNGHDFQALQTALNRIKRVKDKPQVLIADTIKGKGVSVMEGLKLHKGANALDNSSDHLYKFHSGAPSLDHYLLGITELVRRVNTNLSQEKKEPLGLIDFEIPQGLSPQNPEKLVTNAYSDELVKIAKRRKDIVAMDADLVLDTGLIPFKAQIPERYVECGIAEQDMVSMAGGLALRGRLPIVHSFACFLSTHANAQIYNNSSERTKIIYVGSLAGLIPGGPGHSHQSVRDISALADNPGLIMLEPCNESETRQAINWAVYQNPSSSYIRLVSIPIELPYKLSKKYELTDGKGVKILEGDDAAIISYGPVMLKEAYLASKLLKDEKVGLAVINLPWLNRVDSTWLKRILNPYKTVFTLDDHYTGFGQGTMIAATITREFDKKPQVVSFGVEIIPACGTNQEVLKYHGLDAESLAKKIRNLFR